MIIAGIFLLLLIAIILVWYGKRAESLYTFTVAFLFAIVVFIHHITNVIGLSL